MSRVLLIDVPVVPVSLPEESRGYTRNKLRFESILRRTLLPGVICPQVPYSRGLLMIAAQLQWEGVRTDYVVWSDSKDRERIPELTMSAQVVGITCMTSGHSVAAAIAAQVRYLNPSACIILGGPHASALGPLLLDQIPALDGVVKGDGRAAMVEIARSVQPIDGIPGVCTRSRPDAVVVAEPYSQAPMPAYELLFRPLNFYAHSLRTYHGCPYNCRFCAEGLTWRNDSCRDLEIVYEELLRLLPELPKGTMVHFSDPVFNLNVDRTETLCNWLRAHASGLYLSMDTRADLLSLENVPILRSAGFRYFRIGIDSLTPDVLATVSKRSSADQARNALRTVRSAAPDALIHAYWITGLCGSTIETANEAVRDAGQLLESGSVDILSNKMLVPYPGTPYHELPGNFGITILDRPWAAYDRMSRPVYELETMNSAQLFASFCRTEAVAGKALQARLAGLSDNEPQAGMETYKSIAYMNSAGAAMALLPQRSYDDEVCVNTP